MKIRRRTVPPIVGLAEAAKILGMKKPNVHRVRELPEPVNDRGVEGFAVSATPIWHRAEVEELAAHLAQVKAAQKREAARLARRERAKAREASRGRANGTTPKKSSQRAKSPRTSRRARG